MRQCHCRAPPRARWSGQQIWPTGAERRPTAHALSGREGRPRDARDSRLVDSRLPRPSASRPRATRPRSRCSPATAACCARWSARRWRRTRRTSAWCRRSPRATTSRRCPSCSPRPTAGCRSPASSWSPSPAGPGLIGSLLVGTCFASAYAFARSLPLVGVDHLEGHLVSPFLRLDGTPAAAVPEPALTLVVSGGHSSYFLLAGGVARPLNRTRDDAAGEVFDKIAAALGLGYPGGPVVDRLAEEGDSAAFAFSAPRIKDPTGARDYSFSGLKTAAIRAAAERGLTPLADPARAAADRAGPARLVPPHRGRLAARAARRAGRRAPPGRGRRLGRRRRQPRAAPPPARLGGAAAASRWCCRRSRSPPTTPR